MLSLLQRNHGAGRQGGLSIVFFLNAFRAPDEQETADTGQGPFGFSDLLGLVIIPKVLWISSSIPTIGILFSIIDTGNNGYKQF